MWKHQRLFTKEELSINTSDYTVYTLPEYSRGKKDPTCTIYQSDFSKLCKSLSTIKCSHSMVHGFEKGIIFKGILNTGIIGSVKEFGRCRPSTKTKLISLAPISLSGKWFVTSDHLVI